MRSVSPAVKQETMRIASGTAIGVVLMWVVFFFLHQVNPEKIPFDYTVFLAGIGGFIFAAGNFLMLAWGVVALAAPCFNGAAGIIPLLFPSMVIKIYYLTIGKAKLAQEKKDSQSADPTAGKGSEQ